MTDFPFTLPSGYRDRDGNLHRDGVMRRQIIVDQMMPLKDHRVPPTPEEVLSTGYRAAWSSWVRCRP